MYGVDCSLFCFCCLLLLCRLCAWGLSSINLSFQNIHASPSFPHITQILQLFNLNTTSVVLKCKTVHKKNEQLHILQVYILLHYTICRWFLSCLSYFAYNLTTCNMSSAKQKQWFVLFCFFLHRKNKKTKTKKNTEWLLQTYDPQNLLFSIC